MNTRPTFPPPHTAPQVLLTETKPCACCSEEVPTGPYGDDRDGFDADILRDDGLMVCLACADDYVSEQAEWRAERPYSYAGAWL